LGISGQSSTNRTGFKELVAEVSLGHVGIIFGYEVSRLARNILTPMYNCAEIKLTTPRDGCTLL